MADGSKTEKATPKKRRDERKKGHVLMSQDVVSVVTLVGAWYLLWVLSGMIVDEVAAFLQYCIRQTGGHGGVVMAELYELEKQGIWVVLKTTGPLLLTTAVCAVVATMFQTKMLVSGELLRPNFNKINPLEGFKRLFSLKSVIDALKGILKIALILIIIYRNLRGLIEVSSKYLFTDIGSVVAHLVSACGKMMFQIILAFVVLAAADYLYQWWDFERQMRMSKQEIKEEYKQMEGDPQVKGKIKEIQRRRAQMRMMQQVPEADVVIKNPTHFAVALRYKPDRDNAPIVLAKGQDALALRIIRTAEEHNVTVIENRPLARGLYAEAELNQEIPASFYNAVAEVLVYIFKLDERQQIVR